MSKHFSGSFHVVAAIFAMCIIVAGANQAMPGSAVMRRAERHSTIKIDADGAIQGADGAFQGAEGAAERNSSIQIDADGDTQDVVQTPAAPVEEGYQLILRSAGIGNGHGNCIRLDEDGQVFRLATCDKTDVQQHLKVLGKTSLEDEAVAEHIALPGKDKVLCFDGDSEVEAYDSTCGGHNTAFKNIEFVQVKKGCFRLKWKQVKPAVDPLISSSAQTLSQSSMCMAPPIHGFANPKASHCFCGEEEPATLNCADAAQHPLCLCGHTAAERELVANDGLWLNFHDDENRRDCD